MAKFGYSISRTSSSQSGDGRAVSTSNLRAGDLVFYGDGGSIDHVALYIGGGQVVHASNSAPYPRGGIKISNGTALVIATTGYTEEDTAKIHKASEQIPVFFTFNMTLGINLLANLAKTAAKVLGGQYDIEIIEKHHNQKIDAPSGTAIMLADAINEELDNKYHYVYDRHSVRAKREKTEIGMHSVRGGTIVGEHEIIFAGRDEVISLKHEAHSKQVFAVGAVNAGVFLCGKPAGLYAMSDLLASL